MIMIYISRPLGIPDNKLKDSLLLSGVSEWIYLGDDSTWRIRAESVLSPEITRLSIADLIDEASQALRQPYIDWIGELSERNSSFLWWSSEIAAKNPYHHFFIRVCLLQTIKKIIIRGFEKNTLIVCQTPALYRYTTGYAADAGIQWQPFFRGGIISDFQSFRQLALDKMRKIADTLPPLETLGRHSGLYRRFLETDLRYRRNVLKRSARKDITPFSGKNTVLFFTWVDRRNFTADGGYQDPYFGPLPNLFRDRGFDIAFVPRILFTFPFEEAVHRLSGTKETFYFPEQFITGNDSGFWKKQQERFAPQVPVSSSINGLAVYDLAVEHILQTKDLILDNLLFRPMMQSMRENGLSPGLVVHTCEGHSWEQALSWAVHHCMPGTEVVGYDNVTFSRMVLSMYPARNEYGKRPLPDRIVTNGPFYKKILIGEGMPETLIRSGCALRHTYLWKDTGRHTTQSGTSITAPVRILVATAIGFGDSIELIEKTARAFGGDGGFDIVIKCHPLVNVMQIREQLKELIVCRNIRFSDSPVSDLLQQADVLLYTYTSVCYEALLHGVAPVCVKPENFLNLDKLDSAPDLRWSAVTPDDLRRVVHEIVNRSRPEITAWQERSYAVVRDALAPPDHACLDAFL
jgi:hypothetical protein